MEGARKGKESVVLMSTCVWKDWGCGRGCVMCQRREPYQVCACGVEGERWSNCNLWAPSHRLGLPVETPHFGWEKELFATP